METGAVHFPGFLGLLVREPTLQERLNQGGIVGYIIIALGIFGVLLSIERLLSLGLAGRKVKAQLKSEMVSNKNALGRVLMAYDSNRDADTETLELKLGEAILKEVPPLQRGILIIKVISVVAPLLAALAAPVSNIVGVSYPAYASAIMLLKGKNVIDQDRIQWLSYWLIFAFILVLECFITIIIEW